MSACTASTSRTSCTQTTPTQWCQGESRWPSPTSPGSSCDSSTPHTTTQATPGRRATLAIARVYQLILLYRHPIHLTSPGQDYQQPSGSTACFWGTLRGLIWLRPQQHGCLRCVFSRFFTYGDLPLEQHLKQIEQEALSKFERIDPNTQVPAQPRWSNPVGSLRMSTHLNGFHV